MLRYGRGVKVNVQLKRASATEKKRVSEVEQARRN